MRINSITTMHADGFASVYVFGRWDSAEEAEEIDIPCEPAGHGVIDTGSVQSCKEFWRSVVRSDVVMDWIENGYRLLWTEAAPAIQGAGQCPFR